MSLCYTPICSHFLSPIPYIPTDQVLYELPEPDVERDKIAKVVATRGSNQFDVRIANSDGSCVLAILPTKFRKLVWLKRNDYVIVETGDKDEQDDGKDGIRFMIKHILYKEQIQHLVSNDMWPMDDKEFSVATDGLADESAIGPEDDGIVYQASDEEDDLLVANTNRVAALQLEESSDDSDEE